MVHIKENFIKLEERNIILNQLSRYYRPLPEEVPWLKNVETALGYDPNSKEASFWTKENPILPFIGNKEHDEALNILHDIYIKVLKELESTYKKPMRLVNCILNKMSEGAFNPIHTDDQPGFNDPVHTCLIYLSEQDIDFTGGEIYFSSEKLLISPKRNMLIFFEGNVKRPHKVNKVLSGTRQTITMQFTVIE